MGGSLDLGHLRAEVEAARSQARSGQPALAAARYRALRTLIARSHDDRVEVGEQQARVMLGFAAAEFEVVGRLGPALRLLDDAEQVARTVVDRQGSPEVVASIRGQRALLLLRGGRRAEALRAFDSAVEAGAAGALQDQMTILLNRGVLHLDIGSLDQAAGDFTHCAELAQPSGDRLTLWKARHNLAYLDFLAGRLPRALAAMEQAEREAEDDGDHPSVLLDRARVLQEAGLVADAAPLLALAAEQFRTAGLPQDQAEADLLRAECALVEGDGVAAQELARSAERLFARRRNQQWQRRAQLMVLRCERLAADALDETDRAVALRRLAARARRLAGTLGAERRADLVRPALLLATECLLRAGGRPRNLRVSHVVRASDPLPARLQTREVRALVALRGGDPRRADREVRRGLAELGSYQNGFGSLDLRTASAVHGLPLARLGLDVALSEASTTGFFAAVERARAVSTRLARIGPPTDERTADLLTELRRTEQVTRALEGAADSEELARARSRSRTLQSRIRARAWELEGGGAPGRQPSCRASHVRAAARVTGTAFVSFAAHRGRYRAVVASASRPRLVDLGETVRVDELVRRVRADFDALAVAHLPAPLRGTVVASLLTDLQRLDQLLLAPLRLPDADLVVSCGSTLSVLPWGALPSRSGRAVVLTPSAATWLRTTGTSRRTRPRVVSVAGPGLYRSVEEAGVVGGKWPGGELLTGASATTSAVAGALGAADVVHVAAHGRHQQDSPLFSSLRLADGPLFAYELDTETRAASCVVLSACDVGLSTTRPGDERLGLTSVLLHLGSVAVLAGVTRVRDDVATRVMGRVHAEMAAGVDSASALATAMAQEEHPAPFVGFGAAW